MAESGMLSQPYTNPLCKYILSPEVQELEKELVPMLGA